MEHHMQDGERRNICNSCKHQCGSSFAIVLVALGLYLLLQDLGFIATSISIWSVLLIVVGLYFLFGKK